MHLALERPSLGGKTPASLSHLRQQRRFFSYASTESLYNLLGQRLEPLQAVVTNCRRTLFLFFFFFFLIQQGDLAQFFL